MKTICYVAGKSGGHLIPAITHAQKSKEQKVADRILFFTSSTRLDMTITKKNPVIDKTVYLPFVDFPGKRIWRYPSFFILGFVSFTRAWVELRRAHPERVVSMGGSISIPICLAAKMLGIPFDLYELNLQPGKALSLLSRWAQNISVCFEETKKYFPKKSCIMTAYPVRYNETDIRSPHAEKKRKTIFFLGGSQGSVSLNTIVRQWIEKHPSLREKIEIIHQTGSYDKHGWEDFYQRHQIPAQVFDFKHDIAPFYNQADIIICRAGAGTLAEIVFFQKLCITIPLEISSTAHQLHNALAYANQYPTLVHVLRQKDIEENPDFFSAQVMKKLS